MVKDRKQAGRQGFNDKATMACRTGTIVELAIILGYRSSAYLSQQFNIGAIRTLNIIFTGLYGFIPTGMKLFSSATSINACLSFLRSS